MWLNLEISESQVVLALEQDNWAFTDHYCFSETLKEVVIAFFYEHA